MAPSIFIVQTLSGAWQKPDAMEAPCLAEMPATHGENAESLS
jgi:hypothetical protein